MPLHEGPSSWGLQNSSEMSLEHLTGVLPLALEEDALEFLWGGCGWAGARGTFLNRIQGCKAVSCGHP